MTSKILSVIYWVISIQYLCGSMNFRHLVCTFLLCIFLNPAYAQDRKLIIAYGDYPPYYGKSLENKGPIAELVTEAFKTSNIEVELQHLTWQESLKRLKSGEIDALFSAWKRKDREQWLAYSEPVAIDHLVLLNRKSNNKQLTNFNEIISQRFGVVSGYQLPTEISQKANIVSRFETESENLRALSTGAIDTLLIDKRVAKHLICQSSVIGSEIIQWFDTFTFKETQHLVVSKKTDQHKKFVSSFNLGLKQLKNTGKLQAIVSKHLGSKDCPQFVPYTNPKENNLIIAVGDWPPYFTEDEEQQGILASKIRRAFVQENIDVKFIFMPWQRAYSQAKKGLVDGTAVWLKTNERISHFNFSTPLLKEHHVFFYNKSAPFAWQSLDDLASQVIVGLESFSYGDALDKRLASGLLSMYRVRNDEQAFNLLASGKATVYPQEVNVGLAQLEKLLSPTEASKINYHPTPFLQAHSYLLISKNINNSESLIEIFNEGLLQLTKQP